jgi:hypothetical protein
METIGFALIAALMALGPAFFANSLFRGGFWSWHSLLGTSLYALMTCGKVVAKYIQAL